MNAKIISKNPIIIILVSLTILSLAIALFSEETFSWVQLCIVCIVSVVGIGIEWNISKLKIDTEIRNMELRAIIQDAKEGIIAYDPNLRIITVNKAAEEILGVQEIEVLDKKADPSWIKIPQLRAITQVMFPSLAQNITPISENSWPQIVEINMDSPKLDLRVSLNRIFDKKNNVIGFLKLITNETREKGILASKNEFVTVVAHQLRSPLTSIHWAFEFLLNNAKENQEIQTVAGEGMKAADRTLKIINDLLEVAKIEDGHFGYVFEDKNVIAFLKEIVGQAETFARELGISIKQTIPNEVLVARIDESKLSMAVTNILDNAIKYNARNGVVTINAEKVQNNFLRVMISDTGLGMDEQELSQLFKKFWRGQKATEIEPNGSGLGMFITKNIITHHGGNIGVDSAKNRGTTFWFTIPLLDEKTTKEQFLES
jgi:PAS domain S-box-containing protein